MGLDVDILERVFEYEVDGETILLPEIDPFKSPDEHIKHYSMAYPEMAISTVHFEKIKDGKAHYIISNKPGYRA